MDTGIVAAALLVLVVAVWALFRVGYRRMRHEEAFAGNASQLIRQKYNAEFLGRIAYHGGFPAMPRPAYLFLGLADDSLILYDGKHPPGQVFCRDWLKVDRFTVLQKADGTFKSTALLGPLVPFFYKEKIRYFIAIRYTDVDRDENHILLEVADKATQLEIYGKIAATPQWTKIIQNPDQRRPLAV